MKKIMILAIILAMAISVVYAQSVPPLINYQGKLTGTDGNPLTGTKKLVFNIYDAVGGGTVMWGPQTFDTVPLIEGRFNVILGTTDAGGRSIANAFDAANRYLGITVDGAEIAPRQQILSAPFAVQADNARNAQNFNGKPSTWYAPPGAIVAYWGTSAPAGWLICNGTAIPAGAEYDALRGLIGGNVPDLRGMFLRGANSGRGDEWKDPDERGIGSYQVDEFKSHNHNNDVYKYLLFVGAGGTVERYDSVGTEVNLTTQAEILPQGGSETRPKNVAVNYIIKY